jgi:hypothetical protein
MNVKKYDSEFSPQIEIIEKEMIEEVFDSLLFSFRSPYINKIIAYFVSRRFLTQSQIRDLTGFSVGEISQDLNKLIEQGLIHVVDKNEKGERIYEMESLKSVLYNRVTNLFTTIINHESQFISIKSEMKNDISLQKANGYDNISQVVEYYLSMIPMYKVFLSKFESFIDSLFL